MFPPKYYLATEVTENTEVNDPKGKNKKRNTAIREFTPVILLFTS
jgi:hypothetical protein